MTNHLPEALSPESFEQIKLMAGLLTYTLFESLPVLPVVIGLDSDYSIFKKLLAITAAGTVADSPKYSRPRHSLFRLIFSFKNKCTINAFTKVKELLLVITFNIWIIHHLSTNDNRIFVVSPLVTSINPKLKFGVYID